MQCIQCRGGSRGGAIFLSAPLPPNLKFWIRPCNGQCTYTPLDPEMIPTASNMYYILNFVNPYWEYTLRLQILLSYLNWVGFHCLLTLSRKCKKIITDLKTLKLHFPFYIMPYYNQRYCIILKNISWYTSIHSLIEKIK